MGITALYIFKTLHIVGFVAWFSGLFYLVRMFVYHREAMDKAEPERSVLCAQFRLMEQRVYKIICNPAMNFTWFCGIGMLVLNPAYLELPWLHVKLFFLLLLSGYQVYCKRFVIRLEEFAERFDGIHFRIMNEVPTVFLLTIASLAVFRNTINYLYLATGILLFAGMIGFGIYRYKKKRES